MGGFQKLFGNWPAQVVAEFRYQCPYCDSFTASTNGWAFVTQVNQPNVPMIRICSYCKNPTYFRGSATIPGVPFGKTVQHLPPLVKAMYEEARACTGASAHTAAVLVCRKLLMHLAVTEGAEEGLSFKQYVEYLEKNNYLPPKGKAWVDHVRDKGNEANHEIVEMKKEDAELLISFLGMLLAFLYEFPQSVPVKPVMAPPQP